MDIATLRPSSNTLSAPQIRQAVDTWRVGQVLEARVVSSPSSGSVTLKVGDLVLTTKGPLPERLLQGPLQLQVQSTGAQPTLKIITPGVPPETPATEALRRALPRQLPLPPLLANLAGLAARPSETLASLPGPVVVALEQLMAAIPDAKQLASAPGVARAFQDSGLFLERKLRGGDESGTAKSLVHDFKAALLRTVAAVRAATPISPPVAADKSAASAMSAGGLPIAAASARNPAAPLAAPPLPESTAATTLRAASGAVFAPRGGGAADDDHATLGTLSSPRPGTANAAVALPPLRGAALVPQARVEPSITGGLPPELMLRQLAEQLEGAVARLTAAQASQLPSEENSRPLAWTFELPVRHQSQLDVMGVRIKREDADDKQKNARHGWTVTLSFDFPETGPFYAQLKVLGKAVACRFTAESEQTLQRLQQEMKKLDQSLRDAGLEVGELRAHQGTMPRAEHPPFSPLLDLRA